MLAEEVLEIKDSTLGRQIIEWAKDRLGSDFEFRENQLEVIHGIITNILEGEFRTHIIEAPTGSGKSIILVVSAGVLAEYYNKTSYILCSDLSLWKQYDELFKKYSKIREEFGAIKGQSGNNYECSQNKHPVASGECRMAKNSWYSVLLGTAKYKCAKYCPYVKARRKALMSPVTLMTYQMFVRSVKLDIVKTLSLTGFGTRDVIFCDECHNIPSIMQGAFCPTIKESFIDDCLTIWTYAMNENATLFRDEYTQAMYDTAYGFCQTASQLIEKFDNIYSVFKSDTSTKEELNQGLISFYNFLKKCDAIADVIQNLLKNAIESKSYLEKVSIQAFEKSKSIQRMLETVSAYLNIVEQSGFEYIVRNISFNEYEEDRITGRKKKSKYPYSVQFSYAKEDFLIQKLILEKADYHVMTSATVGGHHTFIENCGIDENHIFECLPSTFDYSNSPIYYLGRWKMSNAFKEKNMPYIQKAIYELCGRFDDKKGIIQTWTYANAKAIYDNAPDELQSRMLLYNDASAKQELIEYHKETEVPTILIGPTLNEGIDLPGDQCRFIIMMKMPYPYIGDNLTKAKMELFPTWYENETAKTVIQSIGRGNRFHDDWCITYILDGCFGQLYKQTIDQFPMNIKNRLKFYA